jgi:hypothetical protein
MSGHIRVPSSVTSQVGTAVQLGCALLFSNRYNNYNMTNYSSHVANFSSHRCHMQVKSVNTLCLLKMLFCLSHWFLSLAYVARNIDSVQEEIGIVQLVRLSSRDLNVMISSPTSFCICTL